MDAGDYDYLFRIKSDMDFYLLYLDTVTKNYQDTILGVMPLQLVSNDEFKCDNGVIEYGGKWDILSIYNVENETVLWEWAWNIFEKGRELMDECTEQLPNYKELFSGAYIKSENKFFVSYMMALILHVKKYEFIKLQFNGKYFIMFGLSNINKKEY